MSESAPTKPAATNPAVLKTLIFIMKTLKDQNGRGNFNKTIQYLTKLLSIVLAEGNPKDPWAVSFAKASVFINNGRKLGFLGMFMDNFDAAAKTNWSNLRSALTGASNLCNGVYYLFDNLIFLQKASLTEVMTANNQANYYAMLFFWFGQAFALAGDVMDMLQTTDAKKRQDLYLNLVIRLGNLTYSSNGWNLSTNVLGSPFSEKTCAYAGLIAGAVALYKSAMSANK